MLQNKVIVCGTNKTLTAIYCENRMIVYNILAKVGDYIENKVSVLWILYY